MNLLALYKKEKSLCPFLRFFFFHLHWGVTSLESKININYQQTKHTCKCKPSGTVWQKQACVFSKRIRNPFWVIINKILLQWVIKRDWFPLQNTNPASKQCDCANVGTHMPCFGHSITISIWTGKLYACSYRFWSTLEFFYPKPKVSCTCARTFCSNIMEALLDNHLNLFWNNNSNKVSCFTMDLDTCSKATESHILKEKHLFLPLQFSFFPCFLLQNIYLLIKITKAGLLCSKVFIWISKAISISNICSAVLPQRKRVAFLI